MRRIALPTVVVPLVLLAACGVPARPPVLTPVAPLSGPPPPVAPPLASDWRDWPVTPGTWSYARDDRGSRAMFGMVGGVAVLSLRCDFASHTIDVVRAGALTTPLTVRTSSVTRVLSVAPTPPVTATLAAGDPLLDAMGFSRGRFVIEQAGTAPLVVPAWPEVERVTEDCRG